MPDGQGILAQTRVNAFPPEIIGLQLHQILVVLDTRRRDLQRPRAWMLQLDAGLASLRACEVAGVPANEAPSRI